MVSRRKDKPCDGGPFAKYCRADRLRKTARTPTGIQNFHFPVLRCFRSMTVLCAENDLVTEEEVIASHGKGRLWHPLRGAFIKGALPRVKTRGYCRADSPTRPTTIDPFRHLGPCGTNSGFGLCAEVLAMGPGL